MPGHDLIAIGASAGGIEALQELCRHLPRDLSAALCVVLHIPSHSSSVLPAILERAGPLPASHAVDGEPLRPGRIFVAPPNFHLLVVDGHLALSSASPENTHRPAIDPLFRTAARAYGRRVVGVLLSGADDDGTEGAFLIKALGGRVLVQDPEEAVYRRMPSSAINHVAVDAILPIEQIAAELIRLAGEPVTGEARVYHSTAAGGSAMVESTQPEEDLPQLTAEIERWLEGKPDDLATGFVCPACGGSIWEGQVGSLLRFRCHTGHRFSPEGFNQAQSSLLEQTLWHAVALLEQRAAFLRKLANQAAMEHRPWAAERYRLR